MNSQNIDLSPEALLPHEHPMILIDSVIDCGSDYLIAEVRPAVGKPFANDNGCVPSWVGMEYMAQAIGAFAGVQAQRAGEPISVGFLLGTRAYTIGIDQFETGHIYRIRVQQLYQDNGLSAFECSISLEGGVSLATATINTYQPEHLEDFMEASRL
ncbi:hypothetical protein [Endozoicomonas sp. Mp262]|uniref:ApeP family dehydratase n=1 Tax=Endozoicomonas sp. Mp262 TaxID=2919499 RepID=UPI0021D91DF2